MSKDHAYTTQLHQSRISSLRLPDLPADLHIPYLIKPTKGMVDTAADEWAKVCGADVVSTVADIKGKSVVQLQATSEQGTLVPFETSLDLSRLTRL